MNARNQRGGMKVVLRSARNEQLWGTNRAWTNAPAEVLVFDSVPDAVEYALKLEIPDARVAVVDLPSTATARNA